MAGGTNGTVKVMQPAGGPIVVAGDFSMAGGVAAQNVALWDGSAFSSLGNGVEGTITCGAVMGNDIYLGGSGLGGSNDLAHWNGSQWSFTNVFQGKFPQIFALYAHNDTLYAAGASAGFVGTNHFVQRLVGSTWQTVGEYFNDAVLALSFHDGHLVAGGQFTATTGSTGASALHVAQFVSGSWGQLGAGLNGTVNVLMTDMYGVLYAGGALYANVAPLFGLARAGAGTTTWEELLPNLAGYVTAGAGPVEIRALMSDGIGVYAGGSFSVQQGADIGQGLAYCSGAPDSFMPMASFNGPVNALANDPFISDAYGLYAGGEFTMNESTSIPYAAETILASGIHNPAVSSGIQLFPNPAQDRLTVTFDAPLSGPAVLEVVDAEGRLVLSEMATGRTAVINIAHLAAGSYTLCISAGGSRRTQAFIKR